MPFHQPRKPNRYIPKPSKPKPHPKIPSKPPPPSSPSTPPQNQNQSKSPPHPLHPLLLNTFTNAFSTLLTSPSLPLKIQTLKSHLYARDFQAAFGDEEGLEAYAVRWSPSRALAYFELFTGLKAKGFGILRGDVMEGGGMEGKKVLCLGGGAGAEVVGLGGLLRSVSDDYDAKGKGGLKMEVLAVDMAPWSSCLEKLVSALTTPPPISAYASQEVKDANRTLINGEDFKVKFLQRDVLELGEGEVGRMCETVGMVTLMFTLNELYCTSVTRTTGLLLELTEVVGKGVVLLVVDSPGSYSTVGVNSKGEGKGNGEKRYPMKWLLDHTLLEAVNGDGKGETKWEKVYGEESRWFRLGEELKYPIGLEDLRMQVHVYRRL